MSSRATRPLLITGATGTLGRACAWLCGLRGLPYLLTTRQQLDIASPIAVASLFDATHPWAVVNTAGYVRVDDAESEPDRCYRENSEGAAVLAAACAERDLGLLTFSSDLVFDGGKTVPYVESDPVAPLNVYGLSKAAAELRVLQAHPAALVARTSAFFGPWDRYNFITIALRELAAGRPFAAATDSTVSPTYVPDLVHGSLDLLIDGERGVWHLANPGEVTWAELALQAAALAGVDTATLVQQPLAAFNFAAPRPVYSALSSERGVLLPPLEDALDRYLHEREAE